MESPEKDTVLLVDDNPENLDVLSKILENEGYRVRTAKNGQLALNSIQAAPPDIALVDIHMPVMDGYELCKQVKNDSRYEHIPILFVSAIGESFNKVIAFELGAVDYISKPIDPQEVIARVNTHLKVHKLQKELTRKNDELESKVKARTAELDSALKRLATLDKAKSDFLSLISHELRTPLVGLGIFDELLGDRELSEEESKNYQNIFWASHQKLLSIVDRATVLTRLNLSAPRPPQTEKNIYDIVEEACEPLQPLLNTTATAIDINGPKEVYICCESDYLKLALSAMIETGIKFSCGKHNVVVDWHQENSFAVLKINAEGFTIPEDCTDRFFDIMGIPETIFPGGDLGFAPAVAKQVINACGGSLEVANHGDKGIVLTMKVPCQP